LQAQALQTTTLRIEYSTLEALQKDFADNLSKRRAFAPGFCADVERVPALVVLARLDTGESFEWAGEVVWISREGPVTGTGVELAELGSPRQEELERFMQPSKNADDAPTEQRKPNLHERVRQLSAVEREKLARSGSLPERVALERHFGGVVWEGLLQNPQVTQPEVARIAKNGGLPKPLVNLIVSNAAWLGNPEIRRALLGNPRVDGMHLNRVLNALSKTECAQIARSPAYRPQVRTLAKRLGN
jgi:hypothetical protein